MHLHHSLTSTLSLFLATPITIIPFCASATVIAAPIPLLAPVTKATRPAQRSISFSIQIKGHLLQAALLTKQKF